MSNEEEPPVSSEKKTGNKQEIKKRIIFGVSTTVVILGLAAFFTDVSTEMIQAIFPDYVLYVIGAGPAFLGFILGITDAVSNIIKGLSGWLSEHLGQRKSLVAAGYAVSNIVAKPLMGVFPEAVPVFMFKVLDRVGKGIRSAPRDALVAYHAKDKAGKAFGVYTAMDTMGAIAGPLLAAVLLVLTAGILLYAGQLQFIVIFSIVPGIVAVFLVVFVRDVKQPKDEKGKLGASDQAKQHLSWATIKPIIVLAVIEFASLNSGFLVARGGDFHNIFGVSAAFLASIGMNQATFDTILITVLYAMYNVIYAAVSLKAGNLSDQKGRKAIITLAMILLLAANLLMAFPYPNGSILIAIFLPTAFVLFGFYSGFMDSTSKAMVSDLSEKKKGITYGMYYLAVGLLSIPESVLFGSLYEIYGASVAFFYEAIVLVVAIIIFVMKVPETRRVNAAKMQDE